MVFYSLLRELFYFIQYTSEMYIKEEFVFSNLIEIQLLTLKSQISMKSQKMHYYTL